MQNLQTFQKLLTLFVMMSYLPNFADMVSIETLVNWCGDYLTEDQQLVIVKGEASNQLTVTSGASQGSWTYILLSIHK